MGILIIKVADGLIEWVTYIALILLSLTYEGVSKSFRTES
jgi:hypothetical protein